MSRDVENESPVSRDVENDLDEWGSLFRTSVYIKGDFTASLDTARKLKNTDFNGYNLIFNNCLHYTKYILSEGKFESKSTEYMILSDCYVVPSAFINDLYIIDKTEKVYEGVKKSAKTIGKWASKLFKKIFP